MTDRLIRHLRLLPLVLAGLAMGCGGGTEEPPPTSPPVTGENVDTLTKDINSQRGDMKPVQ